MKLESQSDYTNSSQHYYMQTSMTDGRKEPFSIRFIVDDDKGVMTIYSGDKPHNVEHSDMVLASSFGFGWCHPRKRVCRKLSYCLKMFMKNKYGKTNRSLPGIYARQVYDLLLKLDHRKMTARANYYKHQLTPHEEEVHRLLREARGEERRDNHA